MNTERKINLSGKFQCYDGGKLAGSFDTVDEARRYLAQLSLSAYIVYPGAALQQFPALERPNYNRGAY